MVSPETPVEGATIEPTPEVDGGAVAPAAAPQPTVEETLQKLSTLETQFGEFKSTTSRREGDFRQELKEAREIGDLIAEHGADSDQVRDYRAGLKVQGEIAKANTNAAYWQMRAEYPTVPESAYEGATTSTEMENAALKYERQHPVSPAASPTAEKPEEHPETPDTVTAGGRSPAPLQSEQSWLNAWSDEANESIPFNPTNAAKAKALIDKGMVPKPT